jgi:hypothetical protein
MKGLVDQKVVDLRIRIVTAPERSKQANKYIYPNGAEFRNFTNLRLDLLDIAANDSKV